MAPASRSSASGQNSPKAGPRLRPSSLVAACFLVLAAVVLAYVGGVMSGRAYAVRHTATAAATRPGAATQPGARGDAGEKPVDLISQGAEAVQDGADAGQRILAPEDLRFARALRNDSANAPEPEPARPVPAMPQATAAAAPGQGAQNAQPGQSAPGGVSTSPFAPAVPEGQAPPPAPAATMFDYVFQVAAFKDEDSVDSLRQRLEGRGLRTRMQRDGKLFLVLVLLRGDAARAAEVPQIMQELHLGQPIVRSRKPAMP